MKRNTRYCVRVTFDTSGDCQKICGVFSTIENVRKFIKKYRRGNLTRYWHCWRETQLANKGYVRTDSYYAFDKNTSPCSKFWFRLTKE